MSDEPWDDLTDGELIARLRQRDVDMALIMHLVETREWSEQSRTTISRVLGL